MDSLEGLESPIVASGATNGQDQEPEGSNPFTWEGRIHLRESAAGPKEQLVARTPKQILRSLCTSQVPAGRDLRILLCALYKVPTKHHKSNIAVYRWLFNVAGPALKRSARMTDETFDVGIILDVLYSYIAVMRTPDRLLQKKSMRRKHVERYHAARLQRWVGSIDNKIEMLSELNDEFGFDPTTNGQGSSGTAKERQAFAWAQDNPEAISPADQKRIGWLVSVGRLGDAVKLGHHTAAPMSWETYVAFASRFSSQCQEGIDPKIPFNVQEVLQDLGEIRNRHPDTNIVQPDTSTFVTYEGGVEAVWRMWKRGSASGLLHWVPDEIRNAISSSWASGIVDQMEVFAETALRGKLPSYFSDVLSACKGFALMKVAPKPSQDIDEVIRPIGCPTVLARMIGKVGCRSPTVKLAMRTYLHSVSQYGVGVSSGVEIAQLSVGVILEDLRAKPESLHVVIKLDLQKAFNLASRAAIVESDLINFPILAPYLAFLFQGTPSLQFAEFKTVESHIGTIQGSCLGSLAQALVIGLL